MHELWREIRSAARNLLKSPGYTLTAGLTLALGIGATTAIYTVVQSVLLEPLPYPEPHRLVQIQEKNPEAGFPRFPVAPLNFRDYRDMSTSFDAIAARTNVSLALRGEKEGSARHVEGHRVTAEYLQVLGVQPVIGRDFTARDDSPGAPPVAIITDNLWQKLGGTRAVLNQRLRINGELVPVVGVLPPGYPPTAEILLPMAMDFDSVYRGRHLFNVFGRLKPAVSLESARAELAGIAANLEAAYPASNTGWSTLVDPLKKRLVEEVATALWVLLAAVGAVLLIACTNVANLTLARLAARRQELALRSALGAGRLRLLRGQLIESTLLALFGGSLGLLLARSATDWLLAMNAGNIPRSHDIAIDGGVLAFALIVTLATALIFGVLPAWRATRLDPLTALKDGGRSHSGDRKSLRLRNGLVFTEVALAVMLLVGAGLLMRSFFNLVNVDPGFAPDSVWTARISLPESYLEQEKRLSFWSRLLAEAEALPGVESAATVVPMPLSGGYYVQSLDIEGEPVPEANERHRASTRSVSPGYFNTLGISILRGRDLSTADNADAPPVLVINRTAAKKFWPNGEPLHARLSFSPPDSESARWYTVVGIVNDVHHWSLGDTPEPAIYLASKQRAPRNSTVVLQAAGNPESLGPALRGLVQKLDANLSLIDEQTANTLVAKSIAEPRFNMTLLSLFGAVALLLAAIGIFGVVSYSVAQRQKELGVRIALGARADEILALVLRQGMRPVLLGGVVGLLAAAAASRLVASLLYGVSLTDPWTYGLVGMMLAAIAALACLVPALRATRIDPIQVLRDE